MARKKETDLLKISIVIPSYNKAEYLSLTLDSIVQQKYPNLEVIIRDGGSTDGSVEIIKKYAKKYPQIFKWVSKKDKGQVDAINLGLTKANGDIISFINADDVYQKSALKLVGEYFQKHPQTVWATGYGDIINHNGQVISNWVTIYKNFLIRINRITILLMVNYLTQPATFWRRSAHQEAGGLTGTKQFVLEYDFWLKLWTNFGKPGVIPSYISSFRLTTNNISANSFNTLLKLDYQIASKYTENPLLLILHCLHNLGRVLIVNLLKYV